MTNKMLAQLEAEIGALLDYIDALPASTDKTYIESSAKLIQDMVGDVANERIRQSVRRLANRSVVRARAKAVLDEL